MFLMILKTSAIDGPFVVVLMASVFTLNLRDLKISSHEIEIMAPGPWVRGQAQPQIYFT